MGGTLGFGGPDDCFLLVEFSSSLTSPNTFEFRNSSFVPSSCGGVTYLWDFGDGATSNLENPTHTYATPGVYDVCLTITHDSGSDSLCKSVDTEFNLSECPSVLDGSCPHEPDLILQEVMAISPNCCNNWSSDCEELWEIIDQWLGAGFGLSNFSIDQSDNDRFFIRRLLAIPEYRAEYESYHCALSQDVMTEDKLFPLMDANRALIEPSVLEDPNSLFSIQAYLEDIGADDPSEGLKGYLTDRINGLNDEIDSLLNCSAFGEDLAFGEMVINEFVASNDSIGGEADPNGGYPDWIEFYNTTDRTLDLSGIFVSDDKDNLRKWEFPIGTSINQDDYVVVWADNDLQQDGLHASFKLSKGGESIYLSNGDGSMIDSISFGEQRTNIAFARVPNGTGDFQFWSTTIDRNNNEGMSSTEDEFATSVLKVFPNPSKDHVFLQSTAGRFNAVSLLDASGQLIHKELTHDSEHRIDLQEVDPGMYLMQVVMETGVLIQKRLIVIR